jgi:hypothetical protein
MSKYIYNGFCFLFVLILAALYFCNWSFALSVPYSLGYEGPILWAANTLSDYKNIYPVSGFISEPWIVTIYPPLYLTILSILVKLFGPVYFVMRIYNMLATILLAIIITRLFRAFKCPYFLIGACLIFFFSFSFVLLQSYEARPDITVMLISVFMIERFVHIYKKGNHSFKSYLPVLFLSVLAILAKQQAIVFILSIIVFLLEQKLYKLALKFFLTWLLSVLAVVYILQLITGGFIQHLTFLAPVKSSMEILAINLNDLGADWPKVFFALITVPIILFVVKKLNDLEQLPLILFFVSFALLCYSMGIAGSSINHAISAAFALSWFFAIALKYMPKSLTVVLIVISAIGFTGHTILFENGPKVLPFAKSDIVYLKSLNLKDKLVLTDDPNLNFITDSRPVIIDSVTFLNVWKFTNSDYLHLVNQIEKKSYAAVMINTHSLEKNITVWWPKEVIEALENNYKKEKKIFCSAWTIDIWLPK